MRKVSSTQRRSTFCRLATRRMPSVCSDSPSSSNNGKKYQPWWATSHRISGLRCRVARSGVNAIALRAMSGSAPSLLGLAWWRVCLLCHQP